MPKQYHWRKQKAFAMLQNRRQWQRQFDPQISTVIEILAENGYNLVDEVRVDSNNNNLPFNIIAEQLNVTN
jgi:hypothetical protein